MPGHDEDSPVRRAAVQRGDDVAHADRAVGRLRCERIFAYAKRQLAQLPLDVERGFDVRLRAGGTRPVADNFRRKFERAPSAEWRLRRNREQRYGAESESDPPAFEHASSVSAGPEGAGQVPDFSGYCILTSGKRDGMETLGAMLRQARRAQNRDIGEVAEQIKVNPRYLEALEADDLASLPGGFFYKSFVRQYASALHMDAAQVEASLAQIPVPQPPFISERGDESILRDIRPMETPAASRSGAGLLIFNRLGPSIGVLLLVIVACGGFYAWWHRIQNMAAEGPHGRVSRVLPPEPDGANATRAATAQPTAAHTSAPTTATGNAAQLVTAQQSSPAAAAPAESAAAGTTLSPSGVAPVKLTVTATQPSWVRIWSDGKIVFTGLMQPPDSKSFEGDTVRLRTGNATGLQVSWNGKAVEMPGQGAF